jgi:hypothetical protein
MTSLPEVNLISTGEIRWEPHHHSVSSFRGFNSEGAQVAVIIKQANHSNSLKSVYRLEVGGYPITASFESIAVAREGGELHYSMSWQ